MTRDAPLNLLGIPYDLVETFHWILKHIIYDLFYPLTLLIFVIFYFETVPSYFLLLGICVSAISVSYLFFYWIQTARSIKKSVGTYDEERKWNVKKVNEIDEKDVYNIGFVGDIMKMKDYKIKYEGIDTFFEGVDLIVGNLEGNIIQAKTLNVLRQKHNKDIFTLLRKITKKTPNWLLCISNNHSADYKSARFFKTQVDIDEEDDFVSFGDVVQKPKYSPREGINIVAGTMWSNYKNTVVTQFRNINSHYEENAFNILCPHWHYENECYVRSRLIGKCESLFKDGLYYIERKYIPKIFLRKPIDPNGKKPQWDLVYGHHTHVPQPIVIVKNPSTNINHVLAYSGGNFTSSKWIDKHQHGLILRCQIAKVNTKEAAVRCIEWSYTKCERDRKNRLVTIKIAEELNRKQKYDFRAIKVLKNLLIVSICYLIFTPIISLIYTIPYWPLFLIFIRTLGVIGVQFFAVWLISRLLYKFKK